LKIDILTIFPEMFSALQASIVKRAMQADLLELHVTDIRPFSASKHKNTDDYPFGGGAGMLMTPQPIADAIRAVAPDPYPGKRVYMSPRGVPLTQELVRSLSREPALMILCGHYEGVDERVISRDIDLEVSIGDYVLTGGELPAMVLVDCVTRLLEGALGGADSHNEESFSDESLLEYPQYTRPREFEGMRVPSVLLDGNHAEIARWRRRQRLITTKDRRPDLLALAEITPQEREWLEKQANSAQDSDTSNETCNQNASV